MKKIALIAAIGLLASGAVFAQQKDPKIVACQKAFHTEHDLILASFAKAKQDGKISPQEEAEFRRIEGDISKARTAASQGGVTLQECEGIVAMTKKQHTSLNRMLNDSKVNDSNKSTANDGAASAKACFDEYKKIAAANDRAMNEGQRNKKVSATELAEYKKRDAELQKQHDDMVKDKRIGLKECSPLLAAAKKEAELVKEILFVNDKVHACFDEFKKVSTEADKTIDDGVKAKKVSPAEQTAYKSRDKALQDKYTASMKGGLKQAECDALLVDAKKELAAAKKMAAK
jgi:hypothetical protein